MSKIKINKNDFDRVLLTELLPYELPMVVSNEGLYCAIKRGKHKEIFNRINELKKAPKYTIPFDYSIKKGMHGTRKLSVIHPLNQLRFVEFYKNYASLIVNLCSKSPFSLRYPDKIAKYCYSPTLASEDDKHKDESVETEPEVLDTETMFLKSFFSYKKYDLIYKFFESYEFQRLEQRFVFLTEFDVHKCFYNIYTHSITWAVKSKQIAKMNHKKQSFDNDFDTLMQRTNYNETNGIVVGPEASRIFAEIILQKIDLNALSDLELQGLKYGDDFEIKRYVDDYFVFANEASTIERVIACFRTHLEAYKLYLNEKKIVNRERPFISNVAITKYRISQVFYDLLEQFIENVEEITNGKPTRKKRLKQINRPYSISKHFIRELQCTVKESGAEYSIVCKDILRHLKKVVVDVLKPETAFEEGALENFLLLVLDISFFVYTLDMTVSSTFKIAQVIIIICKYIETKDISIKHSIHTKIAKETDFAIDIYRKQKNLNTTNIEILNIFIALRCLNGEHYLISEDRIRKIFKLNDHASFMTLDYFQIVTLLYYINNLTQYATLRQEIEDTVCDRFENAEDPFTESELTMLFLDVMTCPFVSIKTKKKIVQKTKYATTNLDVIVQNLSSVGRWFMDWNIEIDLERVIKRKEFGSSY